MMTTNPYPVPKRYLDAAAVAARTRIDPRLSKWAQSATDASGAILVGETGCGKSIAAAWVADRLTRAHSQTWVKWVRADELSRMLSERGANEQIATIKQARMLVLDELGYERFPELVLEVIGARHDACRPTIVTSGKRAKELADRYSDATIRRIVETGSGFLVDCWSEKKLAVTR